MNKGDLVTAVQTASGVTAKEAKVQVEKFAEILKGALVSGSEVTLPGIGKLKVSTRAGRSGRNPKTGEAITIPEKRVVKFSPSSDFKASLVAGKAE